jgi:hypothetical protein
MSEERNRNAEKAILGESKSTKKEHAAKDATIKQRATAAKVAKSGLTSRIKGHVSAATKRAQGKRDSK